MKVICAWCGKRIADDPAVHGPVSHGICPECAHKVLNGNPVSLGEFINTIDFPVLVVAGDTVVLEANRAAAQMFHRDPAAMRQVLAGVAIDCFHAGLPGGCGHTEHCSGCEFRQAIQQTHDDGRAHYGVYSDQRLTADRGWPKVRFHFSTIRMGEALVIAIEDIRDLEPALRSKPTVGAPA